MPIRSAGLDSAAAAPAPGARAAPGELRSTPPDGRRTVLVVEDEDAVRRITVRVIARLGYDVLQASDGADALRIASEHPEDLALLVTDVIMPRMNGHALAQALRAVRPGLRVLYVSGYTDNAIERESPFPHGVAFLQKPFTVDSLAAAVRHILQDDPGR